MMLKKKIKEKDVEERRRKDKRNIMVVFGFKESEKATTSHSPHRQGLWPLSLPLVVRVLGLSLPYL